MDKFLETQNLPKLSNEEIKNINKSLSSKEMETIQKKSPDKKILENQGIYCFMGKCYQTVKNN
jgi:hypothetical protein